MLKKYFSVIMLIAAAGLFLYIKMHQRGPLPAQPGTVQTDHPVRDPSVTPPSDNPNRREEGFNRRTSHIFYSKHARCRMECRHINEEEIKEILEEGTVNYSKIEDDGRGKTYPLEGVTHEHQHLRVVFAPKDDGLLVVTCIDLDTEWPCDCK
jgi:hypothetical protein